MIDENSLQTKETKELKNWMETPYQRAPWVPIKHGEYVFPPAEQASNMPLADDLIFQKRDEPIGNSNAFPLAGGKDPAPLETGGQKLQSS